MSILLQAHVSNLVSSKRPLLDVSASTKIADALDLLGAENLLSVPVFCTPGSWAGAGGTDVTVGRKQYIGIVSVLDLISYVVKNSRPSFGEVNPFVQNALARPVSSAIGSTNESLSIWVEPADKEVLNAMEQYAKGIHRALVPPPDSNLPNGVVKLLTQTDIVRFISEIRSNSVSLEGIFNSSLHALHNILPARSKDLVSVRSSCNIMQAIETLLQHNVHAAAVIDEHSGEIVSVLSMSDFRGRFKVSLFDCLFLLLLL
mmetsp:Transcript_57919/g.131245  ORF Transcript_57919/g.131245 Transcript_57919/m.131245 type:complete len:259 (+) Transcript_57919:505-1281(+)